MWGGDFLDCMLEIKFIVIIYLISIFLVDDREMVYKVLLESNYIDVSVVWFFGFIEIYWLTYFDIFGLRNL